MRAVIKTMGKKPDDMNERGGVRGRPMRRDFRFEVIDQLGWPCGRLFTGPEPGIYSDLCASLDESITGSP